MFQGAVTDSEFAALKQALDHTDKLMKADGTIGYPQQGVAYEAEGLAPLVPQNIDGTWVSETYDERDLVVSKLLPEKDVKSPVYEVVTVKEHGNPHTTKFFAEGGVAETESGRHARKLVRMKYMGVRRVISDVASMTGLIGGGMVSRSALETETKEGIQSLAGAYEDALLYADSAMDSLEFDGLITQIMRDGATENVHDARGNVLSLQDFIGEIFRLGEPPYYGKVDNILVAPSLLGALINYATAAGRHDQGAIKAGKSTLIYNHDGLRLIGNQGTEVPIIGTPFLRRYRPINTQAHGSEPPTAVTAPDVAVAAVADTASDKLFTSSDAGDYVYKLVAVGQKGRAAPLTTSAVTVAAGQRVRFTIADDDAPTSGDSSLTHYELYRSSKNGDASTCKFLGRFARNQDGAGNATVFYDANENLPGTAPVIGLDSKAAYIAKLLPATRRPLAEVATSKPFMLMLFKAPHVVAPLKHLLWRNVATGF